MKPPRVFVVGTGTINPFGSGARRTAEALETGERAVGPIRIFPVVHSPPLPVGEVSEPVGNDEIPRTHHLALIAAAEAVCMAEFPPEAVVIGVTTGGIDLTEKHLKEGLKDGNAYRYHGLCTVGAYIARNLHVPGPVITVSTACASGTHAIGIAFRMIKSGKYKTILAGGADSLCRLTYYGFHSLQLIDPMGARPLDAGRRGMSVAEGAGMVLLTASETPPENAVAEITGYGASCDAHHDAAPHPAGLGAQTAMEKALSGATISPAVIDYINLHGTGTIDNDAAEAIAVHRLFEHALPPISSVKGAVGHSLAAAGAIEAVICVLCIQKGFIPGNTGCDNPDPKLPVSPILNPKIQTVDTALSNSFGFGGNNASVVITRPRSGLTAPGPAPIQKALRVSGYDCLSGAGNIEAGFTALSQNQIIAGKLPIEEISRHLPPKTIRRFKRLSRIGLALADTTHKRSDATENPSAIFLGTGWGGMSETYDFLTQLWQTDEKFTSPTDFIGSVHNAPAGRIARHFGATGDNITVSCGDYSFEQALFTADLTIDDPDHPIMVLGIDEHHEQLTPLFDASVSHNDIPSDGGGAFILRRSDENTGFFLHPAFFENGSHHPDVISSLIRHIGGPRRIQERFAAIMVGIPEIFRKIGENQQIKIMERVGFSGPIIDYRKFTGQFASASAVAAAIGIRCLENGELPVAFTGKPYAIPAHKGILILGLGEYITAIEIWPPNLSHDVVSFDG